MVKQFRDTYYFVSDDGKVYSNYFGDMRLRKSFIKKDNYENILLIINKKMKIFYVHRVVAECFLDNYSEKLEVNHINHIRNNNEIKNLEMVSHKENIIDSIKFRNINDLTKPRDIKKYKEYQKEYQKTYRLENKYKEYQKEYQKQYTKLNRKKLNEYQKEYYHNVRKKKKEVI